MWSFFFCLSQLVSAQPVGHVHAQVQQNVGYDSGIQHAVLNFIHLNYSSTTFRSYKQNGSINLSQINRTIT
jgi:hypothetical protein